MVAMIDEALKEEVVMENYPQEHQLCNVPILLKMGMVLDLRLLQLWPRVLTKCLYQRFAFTLQEFKAYAKFPNN